jgi:hypothetical protein
MRVLIYKRTHVGDPDESGRFGARDCMGRVRSLNFDAVVGVGGIGAEPRSHRIDGKVNWVGVGSRRHPGARGPIISFDRFKNFGTDGPPLSAIAPKLADRIYGRNVRYMVHELNSGDDEVRAILILADDAPPSLSRSRFGGRGASCAPRIKKTPICKKKIRC